MPTSLLLAKLAAATLAAVAAVAAGATVWADSLSAKPPASVIRTDEFSAPATGRPAAIQIVLGPRRGRRLRQVPCAGAAEPTTSCYVAAP